MQPESKVLSPATRCESAPRSPWHSPERHSSICKLPVVGTIRKCPRTTQELNWRNEGRWLGSSMGSSVMFRDLSSPIGRFFLFVHRSFKKYDVLLQCKFPVCVLAYLFLLLIASAMSSLLWHVLYRFLSVCVAAGWLDWTVEGTKILATIGTGAAWSVFLRGIERASDMEWERKQRENVHDRNG